MHLSFAKPQLQQLHVTDFPGKRHSRSGTGPLDGQTWLGLSPSPHSQKKGSSWHKDALPRKPCKALSAQDGSWYPSEEQPPPLGQQLFEDRILEWFRLEGSSGAHPVPPPCSRRIPWSHHSGLFQLGLEYLQGRRPQSLPGLPFHYSVT